MPLRHSAIFFLSMLLLSASVSTATAQSVNQLKKERARLEQQISQSKELLATTNKDVKSHLKELSLMSERVKMQADLVDALNAEVAAMVEEQTHLEQELQELEQALQRRKDSYAAALQQSTYSNTFENRLLFILSSETFHQMYRRLRYLKEYSDFQVSMGRELQAKQAELEQKKTELEAMKAEKTELLARQQEEQQALVSHRAEQQKLVSRLQKKQADIKSEIKRCQNEYDRLDKKIDQLINEQIQASQKKKSGGKAQKNNAGSGSSSGYKMGAEDVKLSGSFAANKGKLPVPVAGKYMLANHYGLSQVDGMKNVKVNNLGVDVKCGAGATARNIFDGEVSAVFEHPSRKTYGVLVRHGNYISVYCNLQTVSVRQGDKVKAGATVGSIAQDASGDYILQFQLRKDMQRLNPEQWIRF